jgi:hypothetical protein
MHLRLHLLLLLPRALLTQVLLPLLLLTAPRLLLLPLAPPGFS